MTSEERARTGEIADILETLQRAAGAQGYQLTRRLEQLYEDSVVDAE